MTTTGVFGRDDFFFILFFVVWRFFFSLSLTNKYPSPFSSGTLFVLWCALVFDSKVANRDFPGSLVHLNVTSFFGRVLGEERCELWYTKKYSLSVDIFVSFFFRPFFLMSKRSTQKKARPPQKKKKNNNNNNGETRKTRERDRRGGGHLKRFFISIKVAAKRRKRGARGSASARKRCVSRFILDKDLDNRVGN
jgi:hypothetical protein